MEYTPKDYEIEAQLPFYRLLFLPFLILVLHHFESLFYAYSLAEDIASVFIILIFGSLCFKLYILTLATGPKWQFWLYKCCLYLVALNIILGFFNKYVKPEKVWFTTEDINNIHKLDPTLLKDLKLLDTSVALVVGKKQKRLRKLNASSSISPYKRTFAQQYKIYEDYLLPKDFRAYWKLIDTTGNSTSEQVIGDYYDWQFPDYRIYIYMPELKCENAEYPVYSKDELGPCYAYYSQKGRRRDIDAIGRVFKASGGWPLLKDRLQKYYKALEECFWPTYVRRDLMNDPYFLIQRQEYKAARAGLEALPPKRRAFCEAKLKALGY
jgi:hypothetical protein